MGFHLDFNVGFKNVILAALSSVPEAGNFISAIADALWPATETPSDNPLLSLKDFVNSMMFKLLDQEKVEKLRDDINGLHENPFACDELKSYFFDDDGLGPWATLTYLVAFGTIRLGLLREKYLHHEAIYDEPDRDLKITLKDLQDEIKAFIQKTLGCWEQAMKCYTYTWTVKDTAEDYSHYQKVTHVLGEASPNEESAAHSDYDNRIQFYNVLGKGINPTGNHDWDDGQFCETHAPLSAITIYHGDWIGGIEIWYGGVSSDLRGHKGGSPSSITLGPGEVITEMGGIDGDYVPRFWVKINLRKKLIGGGRGNDNFYFTLGSPNPVQPGDGRLAYLAGKATGNRVDQIRPAWLRYEV
ncbi:hypothetical protein GGR58DRAFT_499410 [Xylaria digitata]|nr:hypothetical protein GGR58DRAFT_499410 [Xylaria digitata]